jgi:hypothetical protein
MVDWNDNSYLHLKNVVEDALTITVNEGDAALTVTPTADELVYYIDNLPGYPLIDPNDGFYIVGHVIEVRTASHNYQEAHENITDALYTVIDAVYEAQRLLRPLLAGKAPPWTGMIEHNIDTYSESGSSPGGKASPNSHIGRVEFYLKISAYVRGDG